MLAGSYAEVRRPAPPAYEVRLFRFANDADDRIRIPVRAVMQAGTFITVPVAAAVAALAGRRPLALRILASGTAAWIGANRASRIKPIDRLTAAARGRLIPLPFPCGSCP